MPRPFPPPREKRLTRPDQPPSVFASLALITRGEQIDQDIAFAVGKRCHDPVDRGGELAGQAPTSSLPFVVMLHPVPSRATKSSLAKCSRNRIASSRSMPTRPARRSASMPGRSASEASMPIRPARDLPRSHAQGLLAQHLVAAPHQIGLVAAMNRRMARKGSVSLGRSGSTGPRVEILDLLQAEVFEDNWEAAMHIVMRRDRRGRCSRAPPDSACAPRH